MAPHLYHELLWLSCAAKRCCSLRTVRPTGGDVWRIATHLHVPPESFLRAVPAESASVDGFVLAPHSRPQHLALARQPAKGRQAACVFLIQLGDDARCGLGEGRPLPCQAFPGGGINGLLDVSYGQCCTCRAWTLADLDRAAVSALLAREAAERAIDARLIYAWNEQVAASAHVARGLADFCAYLMQAYAHRSAEAAAPGVV